MNEVYLQNGIRNPLVAMAKHSCPGKDPYEPDSIEALVYEVSEKMGWTEAGRGCFGKVVPAGARVVIKPNLVFHFNQGNGGMLPLVTHTEILKCVTKQVLKANPTSLIVGDAPIQSCDFFTLLDDSGINEWSQDLMSRDTRFKGVLDFRRTTCFFEKRMRMPSENINPLENYVLFNLKSESLLEPITSAKNPFRVTNYDPRLMENTHSLNNHQYLIAKEIIDSDVVINLPKLKTHKKAGITSALKNLVGINGNKEFLPHHRLGGEADGGDCYPGKSIPKRTLEKIYDLQNLNSQGLLVRVLSFVGAQIDRILRLRGDRVGVEGAWQGNETVSRMTLDLNRILHYGGATAMMSDVVQRRVIHVVDAIVAGQGDGPLSPEELHLNMLIAADNAVAADWVGALLLGFEPAKIPTLKIAFSSFQWPIAAFSIDDIGVMLETAEPLCVNDLRNFISAPEVRLPAGWVLAKA